MATNSLASSGSSNRFFAVRCANDETPICSATGASVTACSPRVVGPDRQDQPRYDSGSCRTDPRRDACTKVRRRYKLNCVRTRNGIGQCIRIEQYAPHGLARGIDARAAVPRQSSPSAGSRSAPVAVRYGNERAGIELRRITSSGSNRTLTAIRRIRRSSGNTPADHQDTGNRQYLQHERRAYAVCSAAGGVPRCSSSGCLARRI